MQPYQLTVDKLLRHAERWHPGREIVTRSVEGVIERTTYQALAARARRLSSALRALGIDHGDRVATMAWNTGEHLAAWYGIVGIGAVCHTLNPRLHPDQIAWIINHAGDKIVFAEASFLPMLNAILRECPTVKTVIVMSDVATPNSAAVVRIETLNALVAAHAADSVWGDFDEQSAAGLCYTSGTIGDPKGVLYSHRSNYIHTLATLQPDVFALSALDTVLPIVPLYHANAWGLAYSCPAVGAKMVMPGPRLDGAAIHKLLETEGVTFSAGVPTVCQTLLDHLRDTGGKLTTLKRLLIGGAAAPAALVRAFEDEFGINVIHSWGMTELSPVGAVSLPTADTRTLAADQQAAIQLKQGRPACTIDFKLTDAEGRSLPHDGHATGNLKVRGPYVAGAYVGQQIDGVLDQDGFFDTGDVATIDSHGFMQITDRAKDVIKSGGEWISSVQIENLAAGHPKAAAAAVIGVPHPKWDERPLLIVQLASGASATPQEFTDFLDGKIARWWMPDDVVFVDLIPLGPTGKIDKKALRVLVGSNARPSADATS